MKNFLYKTIINHKFDIIILSLVISNSLLLISESVTVSDNSLIPSSTLKSIHNILNYIFATEAILKILSLGIINYLRDKFNIFDLFLVILSLVEMILQSSSNFNSVIKVFRIFRIFRMGRIIRRMRVFKIIEIVITKSISSALSIGLLLLIIMSIYAILGNNLYQDKLTNNQWIYRGDYDNMSNSYITTF